MKLNKIAAAVALASVATVSQAAWDVGTTTGTNGELILSVWNPVTETSFSQDLGVATFEALNIADATTFALNATGLAHVGGVAAAGDLMFSVSGANNNQGQFANTGNASYWSGYYTQTSAPTAGFGPAQIGPIWRSIETYGNKLSSAGVSDGAANPTILLSGALDYAGAEPVWGTTGSAVSTAQIGVNTVAGSVADSLYAYSFQFTGLANQDFEAKAENTGFWSIDLDNNNLVYSAVPVPAAVWLFASGLIGLAGIARRKKS